MAVLAGTLGKATNPLSTTSARGASDQGSAGFTPETIGSGGTFRGSSVHGNPTGHRAGASAPTGMPAAGNRTPLNNMFSNPGNQSLTRDATVPGAVNTDAHYTKDQLASGLERGRPADTGGPPGPGGGSESGPGILESWFNSRANGSDPGYEYAVGRGVKGINDQFSARGGYNSGAAIQAIGDYQANMGSQREAQLDALAGGASGEHQGRLNSMFSQGLGIANGQGGISSMYDTGAGKAIGDGNMQAIQLALDKAGVDPKTAQGILSSILGAGAAILG